MNLNVSIYAVYFDAINRGTKTVEYRDMKDYWIDRLVDKSKYPNMTNDEIKHHLLKGGKYYPAHYDTITFFNNQRKLTMEVKGIEVYDHHTTFAIKLGKRVNINSI